MAEIVKCNNREEWLKERKKSIGASDVPIVFGISPFSTPLKLWSQKTGRVPGVEETEAMRMGHKLEPLIAALFHEETGIVTRDPGEFTIYRHPDTPFMHATPDRQAGEDETLQIKAPGAHFASEWEEGAPLHVEAQVQAEIHSTGVSGGYIAALIGGQQFRWVKVERNQAFIDTMIAECERFWNLIKTDTPPEAEAKDVGLIAKMFPDHTVGLSIDVDADDDNLLRFAAEFDRLDTEQKLANGALDYHKAKIMQHMAEAEILNLPDGSGFTFKTQKVKEYVVAARTQRPLKRKKAKK